MNIKLFVVILALCILSGCIKLDPELLEKYREKPVEIPKYPSETTLSDFDPDKFFTDEEDEAEGFVDEIVEKNYKQPSELTEEQKDLYKSIDAAVGWLEMPGTDINELVVQSTDNLYYLRRTYTGESDFNGCYFLDHLSSIDPMTKNVTVFGHNMDDDPNGIKFAQLLRYKDVDFTYEHNTFKYHTLDSTYTYRVIAAFYSDLDFIYWQSNMSKDAFKANLEEALQRSEILTNVPLSSNGHIMTLSTCTYRYGDRQDQRWVVVGKLLEDKELSDEGYIVKMNPRPLPPSFER